MLPDDLIRRVPFDPLRAAVPARDVAIGIEHEDRVVANTLHHELVDASAMLDRIGEAGATDGYNRCWRFSVRQFGRPVGERMPFNGIRHRGRLMQKAFRSGNVWVVEDAASHYTPQSVSLVFPSGNGT